MPVAGSFWHHRRVKDESGSALNVLLRELDARLQGDADALTRVLGRLCEAQPKHYSRDRSTHRVSRAPYQKGRGEASEQEGDIVAPSMPGAGIRDSGKDIQEAEQAVGRKESLPLLVSQGAFRGWSRWSEICII